jgi:hypothetical protein
MKVVPGEIVAVQGIGGQHFLRTGIKNADRPIWQESGTSPFSTRKMGFRVVALSSSALSASFGAYGYIDGSKEDHAAALQNLEMPK